MSLRNDGDLEQLLRATLAGRAATVHAGPAPDDIETLPRSRRWLW